MRTLPKGIRLEQFMPITMLRKMERFPIITVYDHPSDFPEGFVARLWSDCKPTNYYTLAQTLEGVRETLPGGMVRFERSPEDDACIAEVWI